MNADEREDSSGKTQDRITEAAGLGAHDAAMVAYAVEQRLDTPEEMPDEVQEATRKVRAGLDGKVDRRSLGAGCNRLLISLRAEARSRGYVMQGGQEADVAAGSQRRDGQDETWGRQNAP